MIFSEEDHHWMQLALLQARIAYENEEVPVGAILVQDGHLLARSHNAPITMQDPTAHAEIMALRQAAKALQNYRLTDTTLYVTLEPCSMCAGALVHARIKRLVYGASDPRAGVVSSNWTLLDQSFLNHRINYQGGLLAEESAMLLRQFFQSKR